MTLIYLYTYGKAAILPAADPAYDPRIRANVRKELK